MFEHENVVYIYETRACKHVIKNQILVKEKKFDQKKKSKRKEKNVCQREDSNGGEPGETHMHTNRSEHETG